MMARKIELSAYKDHIQTIVAFIAVMSALLYVVGYVAERVHWNMLGIIQVPADHIEFLYRGGNVVVSSLVSVLLYPIMSLMEPSFRTPLVFGVIILMLVAIFGRRASQKSFGLRLSRYALAACLLLLLVLSISELGSWPESKKDLLFLPPASASGAPKPNAFFESYVGLTALWFAFYFTCRRVGNIALPEKKNKLSISDDTPAASTSFLLFTGSSWFVTMAAAGEGGEVISDDAAGVPPPWIINVWARRIALTIALVLLVGLPLIYGSFRFPHQYPIVRVLLAGNAATELKNSGSSILRVGDIKNPGALTSKLQARTDQLSGYLWTQLSPATQQAVSKISGTVPEETQKILVDDLNRSLQDAALFNPQRFSQVNLSQEARNVAGAKLEGEELVRSNRLLLAEAFPEEIARAQHFFGQAGEPMALLYETPAEYVLYHKSAQPAVIRLKKTDVGGFIVYQSKDITASSLETQPVESQP